ncbi:MAG TPA: hypothetical protein VGC42_18520 [Kofleriaceae bacterium]
MMAHDDDHLVPEPDDEPTAAELAHARRFADVVDKTLLGRTPPAMSSDDRALIEVATVIRAAHGNVELTAGTRRALVEDALRQAIGAPLPAQTQVTPIRSARPRKAPWMVAAVSAMVAAAALLMLWLRPVPVRSARLPEEQRSRTADAVVGPIARERAGDASARIDAIFADRLDGFRAHALSRRGGVP